MNCDVVNNNPIIKHFKTEINEVEHNGVDVNDALEFCDASTVVNISLQKKEKEKVETRKRKLIPQDEVADNSITESDEQIDEVELTQENTDQLVDRVDKVVGWLERFQFEPREVSVNVEESEHFIADTWLNANSLSLPLFTRYIWRTKVFLLEVEPDNDPLDLVSGYCYDGCRSFSTYTTVLWSQEDNFDVPRCPRCGKTDNTKELRLMFKLKLRVMDTHGLHVDLNVWKEHAETFLGCSAEDFIHKPSVRETAIMPLRQYTLANTMHEAYSPLLDVNIVCIKGLFFVVNSSLKQMNKYRKQQELAMLPTNVGAAYNTNVLVVRE